MARTTVATVIDRIRRQIAGSQRWPATVLDGSIDASLQTLSLLSLPSALNTGSIIDVDIEQMLVTAVDESLAQASVIRGWNGTTAAAHDGGTAAWINPRVTGVDIYDHLINEVASWPDSLFRVHAEVLTVVEDQHLVELPATFANVQSVIDVRRQLTDDDLTRWPRCDFLEVRVADHDDFTASGFIVRILPPLAAGEIYVQAKLPFDIDGIAIDADLADYGFDAGLAALAELGAKVSLLYDAEISRSQRDTIDATANAQAVPPLAAAQAARTLRDLYQMKRAEQIYRLRAQYPVRVK